MFYRLKKESENCLYNNIRLPTNIDYKVIEFQEKYVKICFAIGEKVKYMKIDYIFFIRNFVPIKSKPIIINY